MSKNNKIAITGLWEKELPNGEKYYSAKLGTLYYSVMRNSFKAKESDPDFILYLSQSSKVTERNNEN